MENGQLFMGYSTGTWEPQYGLNNVNHHDVYLISLNASWALYVLIIKGMDLL